MERMTCRRAGVLRGAYLKSNTAENICTVEYVALTLTGTILHMKLPCGIYATVIPSQYDTYSPNFPNLSRAKERQGESSVQILS